MNKTLVILLVIVATVSTIVLSLDYGNNRAVDWEESYNEKSNKPYGVSIFYKELPKLFGNQTLKTIYYSPHTYFYANSKDGNGDHVAEGNYILVGNSDYLEVADVKELLLFAGRGNTVFMSDYIFPQTLLDTLNLTVEVFKNKDSIVNLNFSDANLITKKIQIDCCHLFYLVSFI